MTQTIVSSATKEVRIGFDQPFVMIGERINPTGRKLLAAEMKAGDYSRVERDTLAQVAAGAQMLDVNAGIPLADEPKILAETIQLVQSITDVPLSIDSSVIEALEAGLSVYQGRALVNSTTAEEEVMERVLPLVKKNTTQRWWPFQMTKPAFLKTPMCVLRLQSALSSARRTMGSRPKTLSSIRSLCPSGRSIGLEKMSFTLCGGFARN